MTKLSLYMSIADPPNGENLPSCVAQTIAEAEAAEAAGFHGFFFGEHHQDKDGFLPSPLLVCAAVAARTQRMQIGTSVILLPLHNPILIAEEAVTLDVISNGRCVLGVGLGYQAADFRAFGVKRSKRVPRFEEAVDILRKAWTGERFDHRGTEFDIQDVQVLPRPVQSGGPPIWIGGWVPAAVERAARIGDALVLGPSMTLEQNAELVSLYRQAAAQAGREGEVIMMRDAWVADSFEQAAKTYGPEVVQAYRYYWRNNAVAFQSFKSEEEIQLETVWRNRIILGTPEDCVEQLQQWSTNLGVDHFMLRLRHAHSGGPAHSDIMAAIERFGKDVIPKLN